VIYGNLGGWNNNGICRIEVQDDSGKELRKIGKKAVITRYEEKPGIVLDELSETTNALRVNRLGRY
jgi:hypothetical protein